MRHANPLADDAPTDMEDVELARLAQSGSQDALESLIMRHQRWVYNIALRMLLQPQDAEDAAQEILVKPGCSRATKRAKTRSGAERLTTILVDGTNTQDQGSPTKDLFGMSVIKLKIERPHLDGLLERYKALIGEDFAGYRNHAHRSASYAMHFLGNSERHERLVETVFAYHDIGIWTARDLAYLEPSEALAIADNERLGLELDPDMLRGAIHWHHKITPYRGPHREVIEACRRADWIDASRGMLRKGMSEAAIKEVEATFPNLGFHDTLLRVAREYGGSTVAGGIKVTLGVAKW